MSDIPYTIGDWVRVLPAAPRLQVCEPGAYRMPGEVPIAYQGKVWYVPQTYVEAAP